MNDSARSRLHLPDLRSGTPGITPDFGGCLCEAASVCLEDRSHVPGVALSIAGDFSAKLPVTWDAVTDQARRCWADLQVAAEHGAYGLAVLLVQSFTDLTVVERSRKGTGFDYWLGPKSAPTPLFQQKARLEVSGLLDGSDSEIRGRVKQKLKQVDRGGIPLPGYVAVTEFSRPETRVVKA